MLETLIKNIIQFLALILSNYYLLITNYINKFLVILRNYNLLALNSTKYIFKMAILYQYHP